MEVDARLRKAVIPNLQPDTSYDFKITAPEGNMGGLRHRISAKTSPPITIRRPEIDHARDTETTVTIILPSLETRTPIKYVGGLVSGVRLGAVEKNSDCVRSLLPYPGNRGDYLSTSCSHRNVYVVVVPLRRARGVLRQEKSPDEMDLEEVRAAPTPPAVWNLEADNGA